MPARTPIALLLALSFAARLVGAAVPEPALEGPISDATGAPFVAGTSFPLAEVGYRQEEFFIAGTATAYEAAGPLAADGAWTVSPGATAPYKTRLLVYRPERPRAFRGTVLVEWLNVSGGLDSAPDWISAHTEMIRSGMIWVGVSAQLVGVEGGGSGFVNFPLKTVNPARYGSLSHPGDSFSYDIYSQAAQTIRGSVGPVLLGGAEARRVIAVGESQSAFRLVTYVNAVHPLARVYDGFLVHSRGGAGAPLAQSPQPPVSVPNPTLLRTDLDVPVLTFQTETDLITLGSLASRQPDTRRLRLWEVAGTAHADTYTLGAGMRDRGDDPSVVGVVAVADPIPGLITCDRPVNSGPQHFVLKAAVAALDRWVRTGRPPRPAPRLETTPGPPPGFALDEHGNARGGIRTPWVDAPVARLSGLGQTGSGFCAIFGTTELFDETALAALYPTGRAFLKAHRRATRRAAKAGFIRPRDAKLMRAWARASGIGG